MEVGDQVIRTRDTRPMIQRAIERWENEGGEISNERLIPPVNGQLEHGGADYSFGTGDVVLLPAVVGACLCRPRGSVVTLGLSLPEGQ